MLRTLTSFEFVRFVTVAVAGLLIDLAVAWTLSTQFEIALWFSAATGLLVAAVFNYVVHEMWTFRAGRRSISAHRAIKYFLSVAVVMILRVAIVEFLNNLLGGDGIELFILTFSTIITFFFSYFFSKLAIFGHKML